MSETGNLQFDGNKMIHHLDEVQKWKRGETFYPLYIAFSPTSLCNHSCKFCVYHYKKFEPIYFPKEKFLKLVDEWKGTEVKSLFFAGDGEPLLNKDTVEMLSYARHHGGLDVALNTNGRLLNSEKNASLAESLTWIRFSINAGTKETYSYIHETAEKDFDIVLSNVEDLARKKQQRNLPITIGTQFVLLEDNVDEIAVLAKELKERGANYLSIKPFLKHPLISYDSEIKDIDSTLEKLREIKKLSDENFQFVLRENLFKTTGERNYCHCRSGPFMIEIDARGDTYNCGPYIGNSDFCFGNVLEQSFDQMWNSERKKRVMDWIENNVDVKKCMPFCRPDSVNRFLHQIQNPPSHVNFI